MPRLEAAADRETVERILGSGLRDLRDEYYADFKTRYEEFGDIDAFLEDRGKRHLDRLIGHAENGTPYFNQMIDDAVLDFIRATPEIGRGVRNGRTIVETKIPHETMAYLEATDEDKLAKLYGYYEEFGTLLKGAKYINLRDPRDKIPLPIDKY